MTFSALTALVGETALLWLLFVLHLRGRQTDEFMKLA